MRPAPVLAGALAAGFLVELLLHTSLVDGLPLGLGLTLANVVVAVGFLVLDRLGSVAASPASRILALWATLFAAFVALRGSDVLTALNLLASVACWLAAAYLYRDGRILELDVFGYLRAGLRTVVGAVYQPVQFARTDLPTLPPMRLPSLAGVLFVAVPVVVFGILFASADAVFASYLTDAFGWIEAPGPWLRALAWAAVFSWVLLGVARFAAGRPDWEDLEPAGPGRRSWVPTLVGVNLVFAAFLVIQFAYLFGGADVVARTGGLTRAAYAREGFFQLVFVTALVVAGSIAVTRIRSSLTSRVGLLLRLLVAQTAVVLVSALARLDLYVDAFGLTRARFYASAFLIWIAALLVLVAVLLVGSRPAMFAAGAAATGLAALLVLNIANPDAVIARTNLDRAAGGAEVDGRYLAVLVPDASGVLVERLGELTCPEDVIDAIEGIEPDGWRNLNWSRRHTVRLASGLGERPEVQVGCALPGPPPLG